MEVGAKCALWAFRPWCSFVRDRDREIPRTCQEGRKMRRFSPVTFALMVVLGFSTAPLSGQAPPDCGSLSDCFDFSLTASGGVDIAGYFTYSTAPVDGVYLVTGFDGWFSDPTGQYIPATPLTPGPVKNANTILWPDALYAPAGPGIFSYGEDNLFYSNLSPATGTQFDGHGVILYATSPVYDLISINGTYLSDLNTNDAGPASQNVVAVVFENGVTLTSLTDYFTVDDTPNNGVALVEVGYTADLPESGSHWMMVLCGLGVAGALCFKVRQSRASNS